MKLYEWSVENQNATDASCEEIATVVKQFPSNAIMSENWLPNGHLCQDTFMNTIQFREPMERLMSHYNHLFRICEELNGRVKCSVLLRNKQQFPIFNATEFARTFDHISDNYYLRSLSSKNVFWGQSIGRGNRGELLLEKALDNLRGFDWILLLGHGPGNNIILTQGLGLSRGMSKKKVNKFDNHFSLTAEGKKFLEELNVWDQRIWEEAKQLHALDLKSIRLMQTYGKDIWLGNKMKNHICPGPK